MSVELGKLGFWLLTTLIGVLIGLVIFFYKKDNGRQDRQLGELYAQTHNQESRLVKLEEREQSFKTSCADQCQKFEKEVTEVRRKLWTDKQLTGVIAEVVSQVLEKEFLKFENKLFKKGVLKSEE